MGPQLPPAPLSPPAQMCRDEGARNSTPLPPTLTHCALTGPEQKHTTNRNQSLRKNRGATTQWRSPGPAVGKAAGPQPSH